MQPGTGEGIRAGDGSLILVKSKAIVSNSAKGECPPFDPKHPLGLKTQATYWLRTTGFTLNLEELPACSEAIRRAWLGASGWGFEWVIN